LAHYKSFADDVLQQATSLLQDGEKFVLFDQKNLANENQSPAISLGTVLDVKLPIDKEIETSGIL